MSESTDSGSVLVTLLLCGLLGLMGQGVRAAVGLKKSMGLPQNAATQQATFSAAYFGLSLMIGFIAGVLAGLAVGVSNLLKIDTGNMKTLLGIAAAGYAGADFIENTFSIFIPGSSPPAQPQPQPTPQQPAPGPAQQPAVQMQMRAQSTSTAALAGAVATQPLPPSAIPPFASALQSVAPGVDGQTWVPALISGFAQFGLSTNKRIAAAIGQFLVEAGQNFQEIEEDLTYTHASRLVQIFPSFFPTEAAAQPYVNNPVGLGNKVYASRLGNGNEASGDGYRFRGRGLIQLTGRDEYTEFGATVSMTADQAAAYCETPIGAAISGCWYLASRDCLPYADVWNIARVTLLVNGRAMTDYAKRLAFSNAMLNALSVPTS
jgi:predicted chitinase